MAYEPASEEALCLSPHLFKGIDTPTTVEINLSSSLLAPPSDFEVCNSTLTASLPAEKALGAMIKTGLWTPSVYYGSGLRSCTTPAPKEEGWETPDFSWMSTSERQALFLPASTISISPAFAVYSPSIYSPYGEDGAYFSSFTAQPKLSDPYATWTTTFWFSPPLTGMESVSAQKRKAWKGPVDAQDLALRLHALPSKEIGRWRHEGREIVRISEDEKRGRGLMFAGPKDLGDFTRENVEEERVVRAKERGRVERLNKRSSESLKKTEKTVVMRGALLSQVEALKVVSKVESTVSKKVESVIDLYKRWLRKG